MTETLPREKYFKFMEEVAARTTGRIMTSDGVWIDVLDNPKEAEIFGMTYLTFEVIKGHPNEYWNPFSDDYNPYDSNKFEEHLKKQTWTIDRRQVAIRTDTIKKYEIKG